MRVLYVTWGEVPRLSSVYGGQVINVVRELQRHPAIEAAQLLAGVPIVHSGMAREKLRYFEELRRIRSIIGADNFIWRSIPTPPVGVHPKRWQLPFFVVGQLGALARHIRTFRPDIVQCRSYVATYLAHAVRDKTALQFKIVFDSRSCMPDEAILMGRWTEGSADHQFWKSEEKRLLARSDLVTVVSQPMKDGFASLGAQRCEVVHLNVDQDALEPMAAADRSDRSSTSPRLAYCGYLDDSSWHSPRSLWQLFASFRAHVPKAKLLVITRSNHSELAASVKQSDYGDLLEAIEFIAAPNPAATVRLLQTCNIGLLSYRTPSNAAEVALAESVFATKTAEYLMAGLPVIVNRYCGGAREYVERHQAGISYDPHTLLSASDVARIEVLEQQSTRIAEEATAQFSTKFNVNRLVRHYRLILERPNTG